jgi:hypothetical protein
VQILLENPEFSCNPECIDRFVRGWDGLGSPPQ